MYAGENPVALYLRACRTTGCSEFASAFGIGGKDTALGVVVGAGPVVAAGVALGAGVVVAAGAAVAAAAQTHVHVTHRHRALLGLQGQRMHASEKDWHSLLPWGAAHIPMPSGALSWGAAWSRCTVYTHTPGCLLRGGAR